jgi:mannose-6-phosphate isomerase
MVLGPNLVHRFYRGGPAICEFRGVPSEDSYAPEDWVGSATAVFGTAESGLSPLPGGRTFREALAADPEGFLGPAHAERFGADPGLLVKLLDAGQRLPVHCHPDRGFARRHLDCPWGKTEGWVIVGVGSAEPSVFLGFRHDLDRATVARWVADQETSAVLGAMHEIRVREGDTVLVPAGLPHAVGAGVFLVELQEPTDFSVLLEWEGFDLDGKRDGHLGLGFDVALACVDRSGWGGEEVARLSSRRQASPADRPGVEALFPPEADPFFRAERIRPGGSSSSLPAGFSIVVVAGGRGRLESGSESVLEVERGATVLIPFAAGDCRLVGALEAVRCLPPDPAGPDPAVPKVR